MSRLIERALDDADTLYPVEIPGYVWPRRSGEKTPVSLYFTAKQLAKLRANVAKSILKANKHRMESR
jgi:hypothetical protein